MAIETNGLKNYLSTLPQQSDVDSIMAKDANGNPIWIKKADLAQVAAELIGTATTERDGLMAKKCYNIGVRRALILSGNNSKRLVKIVSIPKLTYIRYIVFVQGFYEIAPIFCSINIRSDSTGVFSTVLNSILPIPNNIEFYTNEANGNFNVYIMSLGQPGNISHVFVTHCAEVTYDNIGDVCDLDDTCKKLE